MGDLDAHLQALSGLLLFVAGRSGLVEVGSVK